MSTKWLLSAYRDKRTFCMSSNFNESSQDLIHNPAFIEWVMNPTKESDLYWNEFMLANPTRKQEIREAIHLIKGIIPKEKELSTEGVHHLWKRIEDNTVNPRKPIFRFRGWMAAASLLLVAGVAGLIYYQLTPTNELPIDYQSIAQVKSPDNEVKLIFADKSEEVLPSNDVEIKYDPKGEILVNSDKHLTQKMQESKSVDEQLNQLVVPRGKRTSLTLSDGTKLWLNSGSRAIFPVLFGQQKREIFIEGEAYLEVAHDATKPFFVVTNNIKVKVLGTKFNVTAYPEDPSSSVVLVEGSVQAKVDAQKILMKPNQQMIFQKGTGTTELNETDVLRYISWKDGWLYCEKEALETIAAKLSRYYNVKIEFKDDKTRKMTLTGKLDLKTECSGIFKAISLTAPITFEIQNDAIVIASK